MAVFMSYCPYFSGSRAICMARKTRYMFESYDQKLVVFVFYGRFHELLPIVFCVTGGFACLVRTLGLLLEVGVSDCWSNGGGRAESCLAETRGTGGWPAAPTFSPAS